MPMTGSTARDSILDTATETLETLREASTPPETSSGVTMGMASPTFSMTPAEPTASTGSSGPLKISPAGTISSTFPADTPVSETSLRESPSTTLTPWPTPIASFHTAVSASEMGISSILPLSSTPTAISATETRPSPELPLRETTPEKQDAQTGMEPGSANLSSTAVPSIIPTSAGGDTSTLLVSTEGPEGQTVSSTFPENTDASASTYREHKYSPSTGVTLWPDRASPSSLPA
ncbi:uncharacterized protein LOC110203559 [Phascolarctos cinereus]